MVGLRTQHLLASTKTTVSARNPLFILPDRFWRLLIFNLFLVDYPNSQNGRTLWYHDHGVAVTAENTYFGQAGFYLIRDPEEQNMPGLPQGICHPATSQATLYPLVR